MTTLNRDGVITINGVRPGDATPERTWSMQAADDRDKAILLIQDARQRVCDLRMLLNHYDTSLSFKLDSFQRELNDRLGGLLVAREDAL